MKRTLFFFLLSTFFFSKIIFSQTSQDQEENKIPLEDFFRKPIKSNFQLSPSGQYLSWLAPYKNRMNLFVQKIGENQITRVTSIIDRDLLYYYWKGNEHLGYFKDQAGDENFHLFITDRKGEHQKDLTPFKEVGTILIDPLEADPDHMIIGLNKRNKSLFDAYKINLISGKLTLLYKNNKNIIEWITNWEGKLLLAIATDGANKTLLYRENENKNFKKIITSDFKGTLEPLAFDFHKPHIIYALSNLNGKDKLALIQYDLKKNKEIKTLFHDKQVDIDSLQLLFSRKRKIPILLSFFKEKREVHFLDRETKKIYEELKEQLHFNEGEIAINAINTNEDKCIISISSDTNPGTYYFYDLTSKKLTSLGNLYPWLEGKKLAKMTPIQYTSRDELTIHGYLSLPVGKEAKNLPIIINPHGGPWVRDVWGYNPEVQFLANRGYGILQMNFRGSAGYGEAFWQAGFKQWGKKMQEDITNGVQWLINKQIADPKKIAIYGISYGGYAALMGIIKDPNLYAAAIDYVGPSNLFTFLDSIPPYWKPLRKMFYELIGNPKKKKEAKMLREVSPLFHVDKIKTPLFIAQGAKDPRVKQAESDQMVAAMRKKGLQVDYMIKENEGHGFFNQENQFDFYRAMETFLSKHLNKKEAP